MGLMGGDGNSEFAYKMLIFATIVMLVLPILINIYCPKISNSLEENETLQELNSQFQDFTGSSPSSESVWALTGIYTPVNVLADGTIGNVWGYTPDGWMYGERIVNYVPSQYSSNADAWRVSYNNSQTTYYYSNDSTQVNKHSAGDLYTNVVMDVNKQSSIFFTSNGKVEQGDLFYYEYSGYRYSFQPVVESVTVDADGNLIDVVPNQSSLNLIWYNYYGSQGISGQLILGTDRGVAYLTAPQIVSAFNSDNNTAKFQMTFNGVDMNIYIRIDPTYSSTLSVEECFNLGYWSIMVTSQSVDTSAYNSASYEFNIYNIFETMVDLLTFNMGDYGISGVAGTLASVVIVVPFFVGLICIGLSFYPVLIFAGIWAVMSAWSHGLF